MIVEGLSNLAFAVGSRKLRTVDNLVGATRTGAYFMDGNSENTHTPNFNRQLEEQQQKLQMQEKRLREMRESNDLQLLREQMRNHGTINLVGSRY